MRALIGLPITGKIDFDVALDLPNEKGKAGRSRELAEGRGLVRVRVSVGLHVRRRQDQAQAAREEQLAAGDGR